MATGANNQILFDANAAGAALTTHSRLAAVLTAEIGFLLADRASLYGHPAIPLMADITGSGSDTARVRLAGLDGYDTMETQSGAQAEINSINPESFDDAHVDIAVSRAMLSYEVSDLANMTQFGSADVDPYRLAASSVGSFLTYFTELVCTSMASFSSSVGSATRDMDVSDFYDALFQLELSNVDGPYLCILHPRQLADFQSSLRSEPNALSMSADTQNALGIKGQGAAGSFMGVEIFKSSKVTAGGGAKKGAMFGHGALGYAVGVPQKLVGAPEVLRPAGVPLAIEFDREARKSMSRIISSAYCGVAILQDSMGVLLATDES